MNSTHKWRRWACPYIASVKLHWPETYSFPIIVLTIIINIIIIYIKVIYYSPTPPTLFGVSCRDKFLGMPSKQFSWCGKMSSLHNDRIQSFVFPRRRTAKTTCRSCPTRSFPIWPRLPPTGPGQNVRMGPSKRWQLTLAQFGVRSLVSTTANQITNGPNTPWVSKGLWGSQRWGFVAFKSSVDINVTPKLATLEGLWPNKCYPMGHLRNILQYTWPSNMIECYITVVMFYSEKPWRIWSESWTQKKHCVPICFPPPAKLPGWQEPQKSISKGFHPVTRPSWQEMPWMCLASLLSFCPWWCAWKGAPTAEMPWKVCFLVATWRPTWKRATCCPGQRDVQKWQTIEITPLFQHRST